MRIYLIRHGETLYNKRKCYYGVTDIGLNEHGKQQALRLSSFFSKVEFDHVIASPLSRAVQTAELVLQGQAPLIRTDDRLMEQDFGIFEGHNHMEIMENFPEEYDAWNRNFSDYRIPGGESFRDVRERVDQFVQDSLLPQEGTILLAAHKGTLGHLMASLLGLPLTGYWNFVFDQDCYSCVDIEDGFAIIRYLNRKPE